MPAFAALDAITARAETSAAVLALPSPERWLWLLLNTVHVGSLATAIALAAGLPPAFLIARTDLPGRVTLLAITVLAAGMPLYVGAIFVLALVPAVHLSGSATVCGIVTGVLYAPLATLVLTFALRRGNQSLEEQALLDASPARVALRVVLPGAGGAVGATAMLLFVLVAADALISDLLAVRTFAEEVYAEFVLDPTRVGPVLTAIPMTIVLGALLIAAARAALHTAPAAHAVRFKLGRGRRALAIAAWLVILTATTVPIGAVLLRIESTDAVGPAVATATPVVLTSLCVGVATATIITMVAPGLATIMRESAVARVGIALALVALVATPAPVIGVALVRLLNRDGIAGLIYDSPVVIVIGHAVRLLPFGVALALPAIARVPRATLDAAAIDGCDWVAVQRNVIWPLARGAIAVAWLVVLLLSFAEVNISKLVAPPGRETAAGMAFTLLHFGVYRDLAVLALLSTAAVCGIWGALLAVARVSRRETYR